MAGSIQVPNNIEDKTILKRFLTDLVLGINGNTLFSGNVKEQNAALIELLQVNPNVDFINIVSKLNELRSNIIGYVEDNIETVILQNTEDIAVIAEQFGTFYNQALAASWYGLSVKAGGAVAGLEVGSLDPDVTTPGDESSYFRVVASNFILGRAYEDLTQAEKDYLTSNNLPSFGTVYNAQKQPVPALVTTWDNIAGVYKHYFNGIVQFSNVSGTDNLLTTSYNPANAINLGTTTINGGKITTSTLEANVLKPASGGSTVWNGGALISYNFNGNLVGNIGSPNQGFRLSSNATGISTDPNIYGAYIKGGTLEGTSLIGGSVTVSSSVLGNTGPVIIIDSNSASSLTTSIAQFIPLVNKSYGTGFNSTRMCKTSQVVTITGLAMSFNSLGSLYIEISTDGGSSWLTLATSSINNNGAVTYSHINSNNSNSIYRVRAAVQAGFTISVSGTLISSNV